MKRVVLVAVWAVSACGDDSTAPVDAGRLDSQQGDDSLDAPTDGSSDEAGRDAADRDVVDLGSPIVDSGPLPWNLEPLLTVEDATPCDDWEAISPGPVGLPSDATPRQLWRWFAYDDPLYRDSGLANQYLGGGVSIGPDDSLWTVGPEEDRLMRLDPAGRLMWISEPIGRTLESPGHLVVPVVLAPDGTAFVVERVTGADDDGDPAETRRLHIVSGDGNPLGRAMLELPGASGGDPTPVAIGPMGRVYVVAPTGALVATCRGRRIAWTLRLTDEAGREVGVSDPVVFPDGSVSCAVATGQRIRVSPEGAVEEREPPSAPPRGTDVHVAVLSPDTQLRSYHELERDAWMIELWIGGVLDLPVPEISSATWLRVSPTLDVWLAMPPAYWCLDRDGRELWRNAALSYSRSPVMWGSEGTRLGFDVEARELQTVDRDRGTRGSSVALQGMEGPLRTFAGNDGTALVLNRDGVAYVFATQGLNNYIVALQTDVLPPTEPGCWVPYCNARRDRWMAPLD